MLAQQSHPDGKIIPFPVLGLRASVLQENMERALNALRPAVGRKPAVPVLGNVHIESGDTQLVLTATNLEIAMRYTIGARVEVRGSMTIPYAITRELTALLSPERVDLAWGNSDSTLEMRCGSNVTHLKGIDASEYPLIPTIDDKTPRLAEIESDAFAAALKRLDKTSASDMLCQVYVKDGSLVILLNNGTSASFPSDAADSETALQFPYKRLGEMFRAISSSDLFSFGLYRAGDMLAFADGRFTGFIYADSRAIVSAPEKPVILDQLDFCPAFQLSTAKTSLMIDFQDGLAEMTTDETITSIDAEDNGHTDRRVILSGEPLKAFNKLVKFAAGKKTKSNYKHVTLGLTTHGLAVRDQSDETLWTEFVHCPVIIAAEPLQTVRIDDALALSVESVALDTITLADDQGIDLTASKALVYLEHQRTAVRWTLVSHTHRHWAIRVATHQQHSLPTERRYTAVVVNSSWSAIKPNEVAKDLLRMMKWASQRTVAGYDAPVRWLSPFSKYHARQYNYDEVVAVKRLIEKVKSF